MAQKFEKPILDHRTEKGKNCGVFNKDLFLGESTLLGCACL